ncbi:hypothetical protein VB713_06340 [Anabaena cylindrica UHCC 0172]|uniref:hypothetical protein n=1 Tax=Anabaena cylindrica TaxID=1165 RepID=UPI002B20C20E|nr:hypothetical protein [Anabaena cylindrica]MEA5550600.1 hypothetical protein [Anabaena cylindrica UHCC 0172]
MKVAFQKEDLQLLASILQEQLLLEITSGEVLQVKCAVQNDELMILTQHPSNVAVDTEKVFAVLEEALHWQSQYNSQKVQFYVRVSGEKLPYAKHSIIVKAKDKQEYQKTFSQEEMDSSSYLIFPPLNLSDSASSVQEDYTTETLLGSSTIDDDSSEADNYILDKSFSSDTSLNSDTSFSSDTSLSSDTSFNSDTSFSSDTSFNSDASFNSDTSFSSDASFNSDTSFSSDTSFLDDSENEPLEEEKFDPFADGQNLSKKRKLSLPPLPILLGAVLGVTVIFGGSAFFLTRSCVIGPCQELQTAEKFKSESEQLMRRAKSEQELLAVQQQLDAVISDLKIIPQWSPRHQQAQDLSVSLSEQSTKINLVVKALQAGSVAEQKTKTPANSLEELRTRQSLWRQAIAPLESIKPGNQLYGLVKAKLPNYQRNLQTLNQQLLQEETWLKKIDIAKTIADSAIQRETKAKSGNDWQRVESAWQGAINALKTIPSTSTGYQEAQNLLTDYQPKFILARDRAKKEMRAATLYQQAVNLANQAKVFEQKSQWQAAVASWQQAGQTARQISQDSFNYNQAQSLIQAYSTALAEAQQKQQLYGNLAQTRADLSNTCVNGMRFCTFTIDNQGISVRLTPEYDQTLQSDNPDLQSHFQSLREALGIISDNANLRLVLYNSQGQERYMKQPQQ